MVRVRGRDSDYGTHSVVHYLGSALAGSARNDAAFLGERADPPASDSRARSWRGAGGRWLLWPLRGVLWVALLVIAYRGVTAIVVGGTPAPRDGVQVGAASGHFPVPLAEAYASEFGQAYLTFSPGTQAQREQDLAAFVPASIAAADPDLGWNGAGQLRLQSEQVAGIAVQDPRHAVVTLLATVNGQLMELGVPIAASGGGVVVSGEPAWLPAPPPISPPPAGRSSDPVAQRQLMNVLPAFFQAYALGDSTALSRFVVKGVSLTGLGGAVTFDSIAALHVPAGGATRQISVSVIWQLAGPTGLSAKLKMTYGMSVVDLQSSKWYVNEISATTEAVGTR